jgi:hypothetical protein
VFLDIFTNDLKIKNGNILSQQVLNPFVRKRQNKFKSKNVLKKCHGIFLIQRLSHFFKQSSFFTIMKLVGHTHTLKCDAESSTSRFEPQHFMAKYILLNVNDKQEMYRIIQRYIVLPSTRQMYIAPGFCL